MALQDMCAGCAHYWITMLLAPHNGYNHYVRICVYVHTVGLCIMYICTHILCINIHMRIVLIYTRTPLDFFVSICVCVYRRLPHTQQIFQVPKEMPETIYI